MEGKCKDCNLCKKLKTFQRVIKEIGSNNVISGWKVDTNNNKYSDSLCCIAFIEDGYIVETYPEDNCELFKEKNNV